MISQRKGIFVKFSSTLLVSFIQIVRISGKLKSKGKMRQLQDEPPSKLVIALIELVAHRSEHVRVVATHASQRVFYEQIHHKRHTVCTFLYTYAFDFLLSLIEQLV